MTNSYVLYFIEYSSAPSTRIPTDTVYLEEDENNLPCIEKIARAMLEDIFSHYGFKFEDFKNTLRQPKYNEYTLRVKNCARDPFLIRVQKLRNGREIMLFKRVTLDGVKYISVEVPFNMRSFEWNIHFQDTYPHRQRDSFNYRTGQGYTQTAFHSLDLPEDVDIENLEEVGLQSELRKKTTLTKKLVDVDTVGIFDGDNSGYEFDKYMHNTIIPDDKDIFWFKIKNK